MRRTVLACVVGTAVLAAAASPVGAQAPVPASTPGQPPAEHDHAEHQKDAERQDKAPLPAFIRPITDEDRKAAFPDVDGHAVHDGALNYFILTEQLEWQRRDGASGLRWENTSWIGGARNRLWLRSEGDAGEGHTDREGGGAGMRLDHADAHVLYGRAFARWWEAVGGIRQDFGPGDPQTWAAFGVQGLAPYWFEVQATGYLGGGGRTAARVEVEYELLLTNRVVLQPRLELDLNGRTDAGRGIGAGLSTTDIGFRLRYEIRRELAPYLGVTWSRSHGKTADLAEAAGEARGGARLLTGLRFWF